MRAGGGHGGERGQATVEWVGLLLGLALAFAGALGVARGAGFGGEADELGGALTQRMTCAVRGTCGAGRPGRRGGPPRGGRPGGGRPGGGALRPGGPRRGGPLRGAPLRAPGPRGIGIRRPPAPPRHGAAAPHGLKGTAGGALRALGRAGRYAWPICLGVRRLRYDLAPPRTPRQGVPIQETVGEVNKCLNPWGFLLP
jgi:hypothetical protein